MIKHYIEFLFPGSFVSNSSTYEVECYGHVPDIPEGAFGYRHFSRSEVDCDGEKLTGNNKNYSPWTYIGEVMTLDQVKKLDGNYRILISNMVCNKWNSVIRTKHGQFIELRDGDKVISK